MSADNFKKVLDLDESTPEPAVLSGDTAQWITIDHNIDVQYVCNISFPRKLASVRLNVVFLVVQTDGRLLPRSVYGHVITKFSGKGRFT